MIEADLQVAVIEIARFLGWRVAHFRPALTSKGWRTPVSADGKGFPDLFMVRRERVLAVELKGDRGRVTPEQADWLRALSDAGVEVAMWMPYHLDDGSVERVLR